MPRPRPARTLPWQAILHARGWAAPDWPAEHGGPGWDDKQGDDQVVGLDAYWVKQPIPAPGAPRSAESITKDKLFTHSRGGRLNLDKALPILRPDLNRR